MSKKYSRHLYKLTTHLNAMNEYKSTLVWGGKGQNKHINEGLLLYF